MGYNVDLSAQEEVIMGCKHKHMEIMCYGRCCRYSALLLIMAPLWHPSKTAVHTVLFYFFTVHHSIVHTLPGFTLCCLTIKVHYWGPILHFPSLTMQHKTCFILISGIFAGALEIMLWRGRHVFFFLWRGFLVNRCDEKPLYVFGSMLGRWAGERCLYCAGPLISLSALVIQQVWKWGKSVSPLNQLCVTV